MLPWTRIKEDITRGMMLLRQGLLTAAVESSLEADRLKLRFRLRVADQQLAESYRLLGKYGLTKLKSSPLGFMADKEWFHLIQDIEAKRAEREKRAADQENFDRERKQMKDDSRGH